MRQPTLESTLYRWWEAALRGESPATAEDDPQCGWFRRRWVKGGPWAPASITCVQILDPETGELAEPERLACEVGGHPYSAANQWVRLASNPITREAYEALVSARAADSRMAADLAEFDIAAAPPRPARRT